MVAFVAEEKKPRAFKDTEGRRVCVVRVETLGFFLVFSSVVVGCPRTVSWWCEWPRNGKVSPILCTGVNLSACVCVFVCSLPGKKDHFCGSKTELFFAWVCAVNANAYVLVLPPFPTINLRRFSRGTSNFFVSMLFWWNFPFLYRLSFLCAVYCWWWWRRSVCNTYTHTEYFLGLVELWGRVALAIACHSKWRLSRWDRVDSAWQCWQTSSL